MKRVLVTPLDWGLGHATRCIPIINKLIERNCDVLIAGNGDSLLLLKAEFPSLQFFTLPGYNPNYPSRGSMVLKMLLQVPKFFNTILEEHKVIEKFISDQKIDLVISDNRYGCWSSKVPSILITHQSNILMPKRFGWLQAFVRQMNIRYMKKFSRCWIPDFADTQNLAGDLISFGKKPAAIEVDHIGPLSRFSSLISAQKQNTYPFEELYDIAAIFSGPEPQRTLLERKVISQLEKSGLKYFVVRGKLSQEQAQPENNQVNFLTSGSLRRLIETSKIIITRSGYSTLMDMAALGKKVIFIPTPGQTEQEYLARQLKEKGIAFFMKQDEFDLSFALENVKGYSGFHNFQSDGQALDKALEHVLSGHKSKAA